jgi:hypothetical protein
MRGAPVLVGHRKRRVVTLATGDHFRSAWLPWSHALSMRIF